MYVRRSPNLVCPPITGVETPDLSAPFASDVAEGGCRYATSDGTTAVVLGVRWAGPDSSPARRRAVCADPGTAQREHVGWLQPGGAAVDARWWRAAPIVERSVDDFGFDPDGYRQLRGVVERNDVGIEVRSRSDRSPELIRHGTVPKPEDIKIKTADEFDLLMGLGDDVDATVPWRPGGWPEPKVDVVPDNW